MERRRTGLRLAAAVVVAGLTATVLIVAGLRGAQRENAARVMDQRAEMARAAVHAEAERYTALLESAAAGLATDDTLTWEDFDAATSPLARAGLVGAAGVAFVVPAGAADVPRVQRLWRGRGAEGLVLRPAPGVREHYFTIFTRGLGESAAADGRDLAAARRPAEALADSRRMSTPTVSDTDGPPRDRSFVLTAPLWPRTAEPEFRGWLVLGMRGQELLGGVLATVSQGQLSAELLADNADGTRPAVARYVVPGEPDLERRRPLEVADREWTLIVRADAADLPGAHSDLPGLVLGGCLAITVLLAGLVYATARGDETGAGLARALAERAAIEGVDLPGLAADPRPRSPVPHHHPAK